MHRAIILAGCLTLASTFGLNDQNQAVQVPATPNHAQTISTSPPNQSTEKTSEVKKAHFAQVESQRTKKKERAGRQNPPKIEKVPTTTPGLVEESKKEPVQEGVAKGKEGKKEEVVAA